MISTQNDPRLAAVGLLAGLAAAFVALPAAAQQPRPPVDLQPGIASVGSLLSLDCDDDLTAAVWVDEDRLEVYCAVSDGRGTAWSVPLRVDQAPHSGGSLALTFLDSTAVQVHGQSIYVTWRELDLGTGKGKVLFACSTDGGASFGPELELDDGVGGAATAPRAVTAASGSDVYVLRIDSDPNFGLLAPRVVASHDGGATFGAAVPITTLPPTGFSSREPNLWAEGLEVHAVWVEDTPGPDAYEVYYQRSTDGGLTWLDFDVRLSKGLDQLATVSEARLAAGGDKLFVTYLARSTVTLADELRYSLSLDRGATWIRGALVSGVPTGSDMSGPTPFVTLGGNLVAAWEDDRSGSPTVYRASSLVGGTGGFSAPDPLWTSSGLGGAPARITGPDAAGEPDTVLIAFDGGGGITTGLGGQVPAFLSTDGGASFAPAGELDLLADADADYVDLGYSTRYDNYLALWRADGVGSIEAVRVGGLRPQTVVPQGLVSGGTGQLDFSGFSPPGGSPKFAWALAADAAGDFLLPLMDGRNLGLAFDSTLLATLQNPLLFSGMIDASGAGSTPQFDIAAPPGTRLTIAAVSLSLAPLRLEELTDALEFVVQ